MSVVLSEHLPLLANAPDGVQKLRGLIYELAAKGTLIDADVDSPPKYAKLGTVAEFVMGQAPPGSECNTNGVGTIFVKTGEFGEEFPVVREWTTKPLKFAKRGDVLICVVGATVGKLNLAIDCAIGRSVAAIRPCGKLDTRYLYTALVPFTLRLRGQSRGSAQGVIGKSELDEVEIRFPSLAEQHRTVAKVEELMALCDRLEAEQTDATSAHTKLVETLLGTLTQSSDADELAANWQLLSQHFDTLFSTETSLDALKQTILQLAVMGKLVPQDAKDEPASELVKLIAKARVKLEAAGICKKAKASLPVNPDEYPYLLPEGWEWIRLGTLLTKIGAGSTPLGGKQGYVGEGVKFLRSQNVWNDGLRLDNVALIPPEVHLKMSGTHVEAGDLLFNITGASIGRCAVVPESFDTGNVSQHVTIIRLVTPDIRQFMHCVLISNLVQQTVMDVQVGVSREGLSIGKLAQFIIPFPPLAEQHRIVAKVDELMALCDGLKADLAEARTRQARLSTTLIDAALKAA